MAFSSPVLTPATSGTSQKKMLRRLRPTFSPEQGVLLVLFGSLVTDAALAQQWTSNTTLALVCGFFALQAEHPYVVQIKLRKNLKPRYLLWGTVYGTIALSLAIYLGWEVPSLIWLYLLAICGLIADAIAVIKGKHKSRFNA